MVTNTWLKKFKETKKYLDCCGVSLCDYKGDYFDPYKRLNLEVSWTFEEISNYTGDNVLCIFGISMWLKDKKNVIWAQDCSHNPRQLLKGDVFIVDFSNVVIGDENATKWNLDRFFPTDDS